MELNQKVYEFQDETKGLVQAEDIYLLVNGRVFNKNGGAVLASEIFVKMNVYENMIVGYSPLQTLELNKETGCFVSGRNRICFVTKDGEQIKIRTVRNKAIMWNDKMATESVLEVLNELLDSKNRVLNQNKHISSLKEKGFEAFTVGDYTFMYLEGQEPYLFLETNDELTLLDTEQVYSNEDAKKYKVLNNGKDLVYDIKANKISIK